MKVSELGEFGLIELLARMVDKSCDNQAVSRRQLLIGISDDAAAWHNDASIQLATVDSFIQDVHFPSGIASWPEVGWKALAVNLSDIAAMGGVPRYALVSLALPDSTEVEDVTALYEGMIELARQYGVTIVGGDTSCATVVSINITVIGSTRDGGKDMLTRSAARPGERVAVTGELGAAAAGLEMLTQRLQFAPEVTACLRKAFLSPQPRLAEGQLLVEHGVKAAIDISDGLLSDLKHVCKSSQVGARIVIDRVPVHPMVKANFGDKALELALSGGEDYELLFTARDELVDRVKQAASCPITVIGEITADNPGEVVLADANGSAFEPGKAGWEHFTTR